MYTYICFHRVGEGKLRGGQTSNSLLVLYFDVVTRRLPYSAFSSARQPALAPWPRHEHAHPCYAGLGQPRE